MKLAFQIPMLKQVLETTLWTQEDSVTPMWRNYLYKYYPQLDKEKALSLPEKQRMQYVGDVLSQVYKGKKDEFKTMLQSWQAEWNNNLPEIESALAQAYDIDVKPILNDMVAYINLNPVCPRFLDEHTFYVFYKVDPKRAVRTCLHEIMHFLWFYKWQEHFHDDPKEYDNPHLKWIFSEMVQDTMCQDTPLKSFFKGRKNAYDYFYTMEIRGIPILKKLSDIHKAKGLLGLFEQGFDYLKQNELEIRAAIQKAEC